MKPACKSASKASSRLAITTPAAITAAAALLAASSYANAQALPTSAANKPVPPVVVVLLPADRRVGDQLAQSMVDLKNSLRSNDRLQVLTFSPDAPSFIVAARSAGVDLKRLSTDQQRQALALSLGANLWVRLGTDRQDVSRLDIAAFDAKSGQPIGQNSGAALPEAVQSVSIDQAAGQIIQDALQRQSVSARIIAAPPPPPSVAAPLPAIVAPPNTSGPVPAPPVPGPMPLASQSVTTPAPPQRASPATVTPPPSLPSLPIPAPAPAPVTNALPAPAPASAPPPAKPVAITAPAVVSPLPSPSTPPPPPPPPMAAPAAQTAPLVTPAPVAPTGPTINTPLQATAPANLVATLPASQPAVVYTAPPAPIAPPRIINPPLPVAPPPSPTIAVAPAAPADNTAAEPAAALPALPARAKAPTPLDPATQSLLDEAEASASQGDSAKAVSEYRQAVDESPLNAVPRVRLAQAYLASGNTDMALSELQRAVAIEPQSADLKAYLQQLQQQHTLPGVDLLLLTMNAASKPDDQQSELALGDAYWNSSNLALAEQTYRQAARDADGQAQADVPYARLARLYAATQRYSDCLDALARSGPNGYPATLRIIQQQSDNLMGGIDSVLQQFHSGAASRTQLYDQLRTLDTQVASYAEFLSKITPPKSYKISYLHRKLAANLMAQMTPNLLNYALTAQPSYLSQSQSLQHDALAELSQANGIDHLQDSDASGAPPSSQSST